MKDVDSTADNCPIQYDKTAEKSNTCQDGRTVSSTSSYQSDIGSIEGICTRQNIDISDAVKLKSLNKLTTEVIAHMIGNLYVPDSQSKMPSSDHSGSHGKRHLLLRHLTDFPWLAVSKILTGAFCQACVFFSKDSVGRTGGQSTGKLVKVPLTQFKKLLGNSGALTRDA